jgi:hypothetical protein
MRKKEYDTRAYVQRKADSLGITYQELVKQRVMASLQKKATELGISVNELQRLRVYQSLERRRLDDLWEECVEQAENSYAHNHRDPVSGE